MVMMPPLQQRRISEADSSKKLSQSANDLCSRV